MQKMFNTSNKASAWIIFYHFMLPMWKVSQYYGKHSSANGCTVQLYAEHNYNTTSGVIKLPILGWIKQYKCMAILRDFLLIVHCLGWLCNDPCTCSTAEQVTLSHQSVPLPSFILPGSPSISDGNGRCRAWHSLQLQYVLSDVLRGWE